MSPDPRGAALYACAKPQIEFLARQLHRKPAFRSSEVEDLQQELSLRLLAKAHLYDPSRGAMSTFIKAVLNTAAAMMLRESRRLKRAPECTNISLSDELASENCRAVRLGDALTSADRNRRTGNAERNPTHDRETVEALQHALTTLSPEHAAIVRGWLKAGNISGTARLLRIRRSGIHERIPAIRAALDALRDIKS